jgi:hypothetical protein
MDIIYRNLPPAYRGCSPQPQQARSGFLGNLWCNLFGSGSAPAYRTKPGKNGAAAPAASRCWWQAFPSTPAYKPAPQPSPDDVSTALGSSSAGGDPACDCPAEMETDEDVPSTVYIVTG